MTTVAFYAQFVGTKVGVNSLTVTWDIERIARADGTRLALVTGGANSITVGRRGLYGYILADADLSLYDYVATAITDSANVDQKEVPALWTRWTEDANPVGIRSAVGMASANLDTQLTAIDDYLDTEVAAIKAKTDNLPSDPADESNILAAIADLVPSIPTSNTGIDIAITRYADYNKTISNLSISASWLKMYVTIKRNEDEADASAILQFVVSNPGAPSTDGVLYVNSNTPGTGQRTQGSLTVNQAGGSVAIVINDELTAVLAELKKGNWYYDVKQVTASGTTVLKKNMAAISNAVTRALS